MFSFLHDAPTRTTRVSKRVFLTTRVHELQRAASDESFRSFVDRKLSFRSAASAEENLFKKRDRALVSRLAEPEERGLDDLGIAMAADDANQRVDRSVVLALAERE